MDFRYSETKRIKKLLLDLKVLKMVFDEYPLRPNIEEKILRKSILKSSVYSARIEGNQLRIEEAERIAFSSRSKSVQKMEVFNLLRAYNLLRSKKIPQRLSILFIKQLHKIVMNNLSGNAGHYRHEAWGIFNQAGVAIYLAPAHFTVPGLMDDYVETVNSLKYSPAVNASVAQFLFEKIHPFADGNGRVGRLITLALLKKGGYGFRGLIPFEEYIDNHRDLYYSALEKSKETTLLVEFLLEGMVNQAKAVLEKFKDIGEEKPEDNLSFRRREILQIIKEHPYCSFDFLKRRFLAVNEKTLHYDLQKLQQKKFISKAGISRGATYFSPREML